MPYISRVHVKRCRNVRDLDIDLSAPPGERAFRHLILTGPNGSGKSGILEGMEDVLVRALFDDEERARVQWQIRKRRRIPLDAQLNARQGGPSLALSWTEEPRPAFERHELMTVYLGAKRHVTHQVVRGPRALDWMKAANAEADQEGSKLGPEQELASRLLQFLVNKRTEGAFALARGDAAGGARVEAWFGRFDEHLRRLMGAPDLQVTFDEHAFNFHFHRGDGYAFDLNTLADGHSAALSILAELLLRVEALQQARSDYTFEPSGVVIVDEIETHLHLRLQEQILPFLTETFPRLQFVVATHSPAVIASIPGAIVCDLESREQTLSDHYRGIPYGLLMKEHFGISSDIDLDSTKKLLRLRELCAAEVRSVGEEVECNALAAELSRRSPVLANEVWMTIEGIGGPSEGGGRS